MFPQGLQTATATAAGGRAYNQDFVRVAPEKGLLAVADGMGGHACGDVASRLAVETLQNALNPHAPIPEEAVREAVGVTENRLQEENRRRNLPPGREMGTTLTALWFPSSGMPLGIHIGDARLYAFGRGRAEQLTEDHNLAGEARRQGQAAFPGSAACLTRSLGGSRESVHEADVFPVDPAESPFLICSDGLVECLFPEMIARIVLGAASFQAAADELLKIARGSQDNVTVLLADM